MKVRYSELLAWNEQIREGVFQSMATKRVHLRYRVEASTEGSGLWAVIDVFTGIPAVFMGLLLDYMDAEEANDAVDLMNRRDLRARGIRTRPK